MASALSKQKRKSHCLAGCVSGCAWSFTGSAQWLSPNRQKWLVSPREFLSPCFPTSLPKMCGDPKEEPVPAVVWEREEGEEKKPCVLVSVTV